MIRGRQLASQVMNSGRGFPDDKANSSCTLRRCFHRSLATMVHKDREGEAGLDGGIVTAAESSTEPLPVTQLRGESTIVQIIAGFDQL